MNSGAVKPQGPTLVVREWILQLGAEFSSPGNWTYDSESCS